jgi:hypothetical protein
MSGSTTSQPPGATDTADEYGAGAWVAPQLEPGALVYHYTSPIGLVGIMTDRALWATEASGLNDLSEVKLGRRRIREYMSELLETDPSQPVKMLSEIADSEVLGNDDMSWFVLSATREPDDAAQWRLYTGARAGFAVHLDASIPLQVVAGSNHEPHAHYKTLGDSSFVARWYKVAYTRKERTQMLDSLVAWARDRYAETDWQGLGVGPEADQQFAGMVSELEDAYITALDLASVLIKPRSFRGEREIRAVAAVAREPLHVSFRANDHGVVRYLRLAAARSMQDVSRVMIDERDKQGYPARALPVTGITVGPTPYFKRARHSVQALLLRAGLKQEESFPIKKSKVPLRW